MSGSTRSNAVVSTGTLADDEERICIRRRSAIVQHPPVSGVFIVEFHAISHEDEQRVDPEGSPRQLW